jgi:hypothetical protein
MQAQLLWLAAVMLSWLERCRSLSLQVGNRDHAAVRLAHPSHAVAKRCVRLPYRDQPRGVLPEIAEACWAISARNPRCVPVVLPGPSTWVPAHKSLLCVRCIVTAFCWCAQQLSRAACLHEPEHLPTHFEDHGRLGGPPSIRWLHVGWVVEENAGHWVTFSNFISALSGPWEASTDKEVELTLPLFQC